MNNKIRDVIFNNMFGDSETSFETPIFETPFFDLPKVDKNAGVSKPTNKEASELNKFLENNSFIKSIFEEKISTVDDEFDQEIYEISKPEAEEMLEKIIPIIDLIKESGLSDDLSNELKRYLHTLKGSVRMAGSNKIGMLAHRLESLLDYVTERKINLFEIKWILEKEIDKINFLIIDPSKSFTKKELTWFDNLSDEESNEDEKVIDINLDLNIEEAKIEEEKFNVIKEDKSQGIAIQQKQYIRVVADTLDEMINEAGDIRLTRTSLEGMLQNNRKSLGDLKGSSVKLLIMLREIQIQAETQIQTKNLTVDENSEDFDPLEFDRFTRLQELTRFMNEAVADIQDTVGSMETFFKVQETSVVQQSILTNNLLDSLMKVRLLPVDTISDRLYKITRNTAKELKKLVTLELNGEKTEMDRLVLDKITSPLEHLLRNSIAHGIESTIDRMSKGKPQIGKILINTFSDGNFIIMEVQDDGAGINIEKVKSIGVKKGLIKEDNNFEEDIINLIFQPSFSTADTVSQVSGRGVGMDVVKSEVTALGGYIKIKTTKDKGTKFTITIPVAVATSQSMLCAAGEKLIAIPATLIDEVISIKEAKLQKSYETRKVEVKGVEYDLFYSGHLLGLLDDEQIPEIKVYNSLIKTSYQNKEVLIHVDKIITTTEVLIKSMGPMFAKINGLLGATLLGNGKQGLVINPVLLSEHYSVNKKSINNKNTNNTTVKNQIKTKTVLVVDDSITVRRATTKVLEKYGFHVVTAKDGADGLEQLQLILPDIILSDIEMPKMDGFEFARTVKTIDNYKNIPIIMITSRTAEKHKSLAYEIGVNGFLGKPYKEDELIGNINKLINARG